jgi:hypothetical protein
LDFARALLLQLNCSNFKKKERVGKFVSALKKDSSSDKLARQLIREVSPYKIAVSRARQRLKLKYEI